MKMVLTAFMVITGAYVIVTIVRSVIRDNN